jgi:hypothetical protein
MVAVGWRSDGWELQVAGGGAVIGGARWHAAAPRRNIAGDGLTGALCAKTYGTRTKRKRGTRETH